MRDLLPGLIGRAHEERLEIFDEALGSPVLEGCRKAGLEVRVSTESRRLVDVQRPTLWLLIGINADPITDNTTNLPKLKCRTVLLNEETTIGAFKEDVGSHATGVGFHRVLVG